MINIFAIHGAYSSPNIFNYMKRKLGNGYSWTFLNYQNQVNDLNGIIDSIPDLLSPHHIIGHSMGGLIGLKIISKSWVKSVITIATPLGGLELNIIQRYLSQSSFLSEIADYSDCIESIRNIKTNKPIQHIISTKGYNPYNWFEQTDGVITIKSQLAYNLGPIYEVEASHIEVMLIDKTSNYVESFLN